MKTKVSNMLSNNNNKIANQFIISTGKSTIFQSYNSIIVKRTNKNIYLDSYYWDYSKTTAKYRNMFLGETTKETQQKIDSGIYKLTNLMDDESKLKMGVSGGQLTNCRVRHELGELPLPTMPARYQLYHGDVSIEDSMRNFVGTNKKSCNPKDEQFYNRSFYTFEGIEKPDAMKSVEYPFRCGISSRYHVEKEAKWPQGNQPMNKTNDESV